MIRNFVLSLSFMSLTGPAAADTGLALPAEAAVGLEEARAAADVVVLVRRHPGLAATLMADAAALGIASPAAVLAGLVAEGIDCRLLYTLTSAAAEAAPPEADISAAAAMAAARPLPCAMAAIARGTVDGLEAAGLTGPLLAAEIGEIAAVLSTAVPGAEREIAGLIAEATDRADDTADMVLTEAAGGIETADTGARAGGGAASAVGNVPLTRVPPFVTIPDEAQNTPSRN